MTSNGTFNHTKPQHILYTIKAQSTPHVAIRSNNKLSKQQQSSSSKATTTDQQALQRHATLPPGCPLPRGFCIHFNHPSIPGIVKEHYTPSLLPWSDCQQHELHPSACSNHWVWQQCDPTCQPDLRGLGHHQKESTGGTHREQLHQVPPISISHCVNTLHACRVPLAISV